MTAASSSSFLTSPAESPLAVRRRSVGLSAGYMTLSTASFALSGFFGEQASLGGDVRLTLLARFAIPLLFTLPVVLPFGGTRHRLHTTNVRTHALRALSLVASQYCFFVATLHTSLFQAMTLYNTGPLFILVFSRVFLRNAWSPSTAAGVAIGFLGTTATLWHGLAATNPYIIVGVVSGILLALSQMALHRCAQSEPSSHTMFWTYALGTLFASLPILAAPSALGHPAVGFGSIRIGAAVLMAFGSLGNQFFRSHAYRCVTDPAAVSPLLYLTIVFSLALDVVGNGHLPSPLAVVGAALIITGASLPTVVGRAKRRT
jgi:drug/metabolite transporter (DMT)-like permease